jgi:hypothetical protein
VEALLLCLCGQFVQLEQFLHLLQGGAVVLADSQHLTDNFLQTEADVGGKGEGKAHNALEEGGFVPALPGELAEQQLVKDDA